MANNTNKNLNPLAKAGLDNMKQEVASELGIENYNQIDKGELSSRANGYVGGNMVKKMIQMAEDMMSQNPNIQQEITNNPNADLETSQGDVPPQQ